MRYLVGLLLVVLVGCTQPVTPSPSSSAIGPPSSPSMPSSPSANPTCSPMGGTPRPCSPEEFQKTEEQNRLTEEAIALYRRWIAESTRLYRAGGTDKPTKEMRSILAGEALQSGLAVFQDLKQSKATAISGELKLLKSGADLDVSAPTGGVAISTCVDGRSLVFQRNGKPISKGPLFAEHVVAKPVDGRLLLWSVSSELVKSC